MELAIGPIDAAILITYLVAVVAFGLWIGRGQRDAASYLLGGRNLPWWALLLSIVATETSTVTFLSIPGVAFNPEGGSLVFLQLTIGYILGRLVVVFVFLPQYFRGKLFTSYEVLDRRFGGVTKQTASLLFVVTRNLADGLRLYLTAIVLHYVLGCDLWMCIVLVGLTTIVYTVRGGMKSVVWNDCIQFFIYMAGGLIAMAVILGRLDGGWTQLADYAREHGKFHLVDLRFDPARAYTLWSGILGGLFVALATHGTDQLMVQRYLSARSRKEASWALSLSGVVVCVQFALFLLIGVALACFYQSFPPNAPFVAGEYDRVFPAFIVEHLPVGLAGLIVAAVFAAAMSTLSSSLNSSAAAAVNDLYLPSLRRRNEEEAQKPSPEHLLRVSRRLTVLFGLVQIGVAFGGQLLHKSVVESVMAISLFTTGAILGVFFLGILTRFVSQRAALVGLIAGLAVMATIAIGIPWYTEATLLAWPWYGLVGSTVTFVVGLASSLVWRQPPKSTNSPCNA